MKHKAQSLIEYALILILISTVAITTLHLLGKNSALNKSSAYNNTEQNIIDTMTNYCKNKNQLYDKKTEQCVELKALTTEE